MWARGRFACGIAATGFWAVLGADSLGKPRTVCCESSRKPVPGVVERQSGLGKWTLESILKELKPPQIAQNLKVCKFPKAIADGVISQVLQFEEENRMTLGRVQRDGNGIKQMQSPWKTTYLHTNYEFQEKFPQVVNNLIDLAIEADLKQGWGILCGSKEDLRIRVIEVHHVEENGSLPDPHHLDFGSLVTVDVMCVDSSEFQGGNFSTLEKTGEMRGYSFEKGDVLVFPSHKYHCVQPVTSGHRTVLVMELWRGMEKSCAHRCIEHLQDCNFSVTQNQIERLLTTAFPEVDPW